MNEGETSLTKKMKQDKTDFLKKHSGGKATSEDFEKALGNKSSQSLNIVSVVKKRENEDDVEELEKSTKNKKSHKRQK